MHLVKIRLHRVDEGDIKAVLPDAGAACRLDPVFVPRAVWRQHEIIGAKGHLMAVNHGISAAAFHDEPNGRGRVPVR